MNNNSNALVTDYQKFIHTSKYSRFMWDEMRRESWSETVGRWEEFFANEVVAKVEDETNRKKLEKALKKVVSSIAGVEVMPSMRTMMTAGPALIKNNIAAYNCSYTAINRPQAFDEIMYILSCGTGVGFSVERQEIAQLPTVADEFHKSDIVIKVQDSKEGWAKSLKEFIALLYQGQIPSSDTSLVRKKGAPLITFGGRASGPEPLEKLFAFCAKLFQGAAGRKLTSLECHDLVCRIADAIVSGGVRRSALISLSNLSDDRMRAAKSGDWHNTHIHRSMANNSAVYNEKPDVGLFMQEWKSLYDSKSGERGIFNRQAAKLKAESIGRDPNWDFGTNPCVTGDTLIAVADGRGQVPIKELAQFGIDVPVYCVDDSGKIVIRKMRRPRLTGKGLPVYEIKFAEGGSVKATANHKFMTKSGEYKRVDELVRGDQFETFSRLQDKIWNKENGANYWHIQKGSKRRSEHRMIAEYYHNPDLDSTFGSVVHHKDYNSLNNCPDNLEVMTSAEHNILHSKDMIGDKNPMRRAQTEWSKDKWIEYKTNMSKATAGESNGMYSEISHDEMREHAKNLTMKLGKRYSTKDWCEYAKENNIPISFSKWRQETLGTVVSLSKWAAMECGFVKYLNLDPRSITRASKWLNQGYDCDLLEDGTLNFHKVCECCGESFISDKPEVSNCSNTCGSKTAANSRSNISKEIKLGWENKHVKVRSEQLDVFTELRMNLERIPEKKEWARACKNKRISSEVSRPTSPFTSWKSLKEAATSYNHRVSSIELIGHEDVYNGTVDDFHNFGVVCDNIINEKTKLPQAVIIITKNCGEIVLRSQGFCNLSEVIIRPTDTMETLREKVELASIIGTLQSTLTNFKYVSKKWKTNAEEERLLGVSMTGIFDNPLTNGNEPNLESRLAELRQLARDTNIKYAKLLGINPSAAITCTKPSGCTSLETKIKVNLDGKDKLMTMAEIFMELAIQDYTFESGDWLEPQKEAFVYDENNELKQITKLFVNGVAEVYEITDENGKTYKFTAEHKLKTTNGWKRVDELLVNDDIVSFKPS